MSSLLPLLFEATNGSQFSPAQCARMLSELATVDPASIPSEQTSNVLDFLNAQLLYQQVDADLLKPIEGLTAELATRL